MMCSISYHTNFFEKIYQFSILGALPPVTARHPNVSLRAALVRRPPCISTPHSRRRPRGIAAAITPFPTEEEHMSTLIEELQQFTGSDQFYRHPLFRKYVYTEGVHYLAEKGQCHWLIDFVLSNQLDKKIKGQPFQVWSITVKDDHSASIQVEDGNENKLHRFELTFTDFPLKTFSLWLVEQTLLLPSEY